MNAADYDQALRVDIAALRRIARYQASSSSSTTTNNSSSSSNTNATDTSTSTATSTLSTISPIGLVRLFARFGKIEFRRFSNFEKQ